MIRKFPHLSSPIQIGNVTFRNRMAAAPMGGTDITPEGSIGRRSTAFYELRAKGGAAAVTVSELIVHPETDASQMFHIGLETPGSLSGFTYTADAIRRHGAIPSIELSHGGRFAALGLPSVKYGPSAGQEADGSVVQELTPEQIREIVAAYGRAAGLAKRAGFEMVMVHGGHSWLINQFFSPCYNHRTDAYGGKLENRCRFALEVLSSVRDAVGPGFPIEFRMSGVESLNGGYGLDTAVEIAQIIEPHIDLLHVSAGSHFNGFDVTHPSMFSPHGVNVYLAAEIKKHVSLPVATVGALGDPDRMEEIVASGQADVVYMARALLADPYLPWKVMSNREEEIIRCMRCYTCMAERGVTKTRRCALNPQIGREIEGFQIQLAPKRQKVLIAGGGPGGLEAALIAAQRGHKTILCEKTERLGGIPNCEEGVPFKEAMFGFAKTMEHLLRREGVEIRLNTPVTAAYAEEENADVLICAVGSEPLVPPLPGIDGRNVIPVSALPARRKDIGQKVIVLGGGLAGCETAVHLADVGKAVVLVEMRDTLAPDANHFQGGILLERLRGRVEIMLGYKGICITEAGLYCMSPDGSEAFISADTVILAAGQRPNRRDAEALLNAAPRVYQIGDCVAPRDMTAAIYQGYHAAMDV
jgi:2,4-dienoyl-CoA reductase-like NADH-dependent reductase (Old Yellow Enzyme family)/thioredoxin reductase